MSAAEVSSVGKGIAQLVRERTDRGVGLMNVEQLLQMMNKAGEAHGATVMYKKKNVDTGDLSEPEARDVRKTNFDMQMTQLAKMVAGLPVTEKLAFAAEMRRQGNEKFTSGDFDAASALYVQSLVGLDFGDGSAEARKRAIREVQVPVLTNLAACALNSHNFEKCVSLCDGALQLDPSAWKAHGRKGSAYIALGEYREAREALRGASVAVERFGASAAASSQTQPAPMLAGLRDAAQRAIARELHRLRQHERRSREAVRKTKDALCGALAGADSDVRGLARPPFELYGEKKDILPATEYASSLRDGSLRLTGQSVDLAEAGRVKYLRAAKNGGEELQGRSRAALILDVALPSLACLGALAFRLGECIFIAVSSTMETGISVHDEDTPDVMADRAGQDL